LDIFRKFDDFGIHLENLKIGLHHGGTVFPFEDLTQSQQSKYIRKLTLDDIIPEPMHLMSNMEAPTYLTISTPDIYESRHYQSSKTINFGQLIEACPTTLTVLSSTGITLAFNEPASNQTSIEYLILYCIHLDQSLANAIETNFLQLVDLRFYVAIKNDVILSLPNHNLKDVSMKFGDWQIGNDIGFVITTTNNNKVEYYLKKEFELDNGYGYIDTDFRISRVPRKKLRKVPVLSLTCASIDNLSLEAERDYK
jgi:hypothetical protein